MTEETLNKAARLYLRRDVLRRALNDLGYLAYVKFHIDEGELLPQDDYNSTLRSHLDEADSQVRDAIRKEISDIDKQIEQL